MSLLEEVLKEERKVLKELGYQLDGDSANEAYPETYYKDYPYNLFENKEGIYHIEYEKQYETIKTGKRSQPANLDAFLLSEDETEILFCEMKMMEWFSKNTGKLAEAYKNIDNYRYKEQAPLFFEAIKQIEQAFPAGYFEYYDVWQMLKHTLAVKNYLRDHKEKNYSKVTLLNVVFEPDPYFLSDKEKAVYENQRSKEHEGFEQFRSILTKAGILDADENFDVKYLSAKAFIDSFAISEKKRTYLRRYTLEEQA